MLKNQFEKEKHAIIERHKEEMDAMKAEHMRSRERMSGIVGQGQAR